MFNPLFYQSFVVFFLSCLGQLLLFKHFVSLHGNKNLEKPIPDSLNWKSEIADILLINF